MRFYVLFALITAASYATASLLAAWLAAAVWPTLRVRAQHRGPAARARLLAAWRLAPAMAGATLAAVLAGAFFRFEPRDTTEAPGALLVGAAGLALLFSLHAAVRLLRALRSHVECSRVLRASGRLVRRADGMPVWIVDTDYPVAAVTGLFRTQLVLSTRILTECTAGEIEAVVRHERAHVSRRDNLVRAAILAVPNPLSLTPTGREMQSDWSAAAEECADDAAAGGEEEARTALASALVRVARMTRTPAPGWIPALAFYEGSNLEHRVRRLLMGRGGGSRITPGPVLALLAAAAGAALALTETAAREVHVWMELAVHFVP
jgi:hypothetical protein